MREGSGKELHRLYDTILQHIRALKTMDGDLTGAFLTSIIELKLDADTIFEWQKHSQEQKTTPQYEDILGFIDLRTQASETAAVGKKQVKINQTGGGKPHHSGRNVTSFATHADSKHHCVLCEPKKHLLYACPKFKGMALVEKLSTLQNKRLCKNGLGGGHFVRQGRLLHKCKKCQRPYHTLLYDDQEDQARHGNHVASNAAVKLRSSSLLMICHVLVTAPNGSSMEARTLLDNASSASFVTQHLAQSLSLPHSRRTVHISGIAGVSPSCPTRSIASMEVLPTTAGAGSKIALSAVVVPKVTCDLPLSPVPFDPSWQYLSGLPLADPGCGKPGRIDLLLCVEVFVDVLLNGWWTGPPGSQVALKTKSAGFSVEARNIPILSAFMLLLSTSPLLLKMIYFDVSGRLRIIRWNHSRSRQTRSTSSSTTLTIMPVPTLGDLLSLSQGSLMLVLSANLARKLFGDFYHSNAPYAQ